MLVPCGARERPDAVTSQEKNKDDRQGDKRWMGARPTYRWRGARVRERLSVSQSSSSCTTDHIGVQKSVARSYRHVCCLCFVLCKLHTYEVVSWNEYTRGLTVCRYWLWTYTSVCREERFTETKYSLWRWFAIWGKKQTYEWLHTVPVPLGLLETFLSIAKKSIMGRPHILKYIWQRINNCCFIYLYIY